MADVIITGATRGIGRALALALPASVRLVVTGRNAVAVGHVVRDLARQGKAAEAVVGNLSTVSAARALGERLSKSIRAGATLVHNAGVWPSQLVMTEDGYESAYMTNFLGPLAMQEPLLAAQLVKRIMVIGTGLMVKGHFDAQRTPSGVGFSPAKAYANTKLAMAVAMRDVAEAYTDVEVIVVHPGLVNTELGARRGLTGWLVRQLKKRWEDPSVTGARLAKILAHDHTATPGEAVWMNGDVAEPWPSITDSARESVRQAVVANSRP